MSFIGKDSWLSNQDIKGHGEDETGRPVSPAPSIEGDVNEAEQINVVFPDGEDPVTMTRRDFMRVSSTTAAAGALATTSACQSQPNTSHRLPSARKVLTAGKS